MIRFLHVVVLVLAGINGLVGVGFILYRVLYDNTNIIFPGLGIVVTLELLIFVFVAVQAVLFGLQFLLGTILQRRRQGGPV